MNIFEHAESVREIMDLLLQPEIEVPKLLPDASNAEEVEEARALKAQYDEMLANTLESVMADFQDKAEAYGWVLRELEGRSEALKKAKQDIDKKMKALSGRQDRLKDALKKALEMIGQKKLQTETFTYSTRASKSVVVTAESVWDIPEELLRFSDPEPDKVAIKAYLQENEVPWAHMEERTSLVVK